MYNRYVRNDQGAYSRVQQQDFSAPQPPRTDINGGQTEQKISSPEKQHTDTGEVQRQAERPAELRLVNRLLAKLRLHDIDAGDLLLLILLFILFREDGDEELLIAIGLLLIM